MNCGKDGLRACRPSNGAGGGGRLVLCRSFKSGFPSSTLVFHPPPPPFFFKSRTFTTARCAPVTSCLFCPDEVVVKLETNRVICA